MRHRDEARFVDHEAFDLAEHRRGAHAESVAPVAISGAYDGERGFAPLHHTDLAVRGVRTQEQAARQEEGVLHLARGMVGREVERAEVMEVVLDVLRRYDFETHRGEDVEHPFEALRHRMEPSARDAHAGECDIDARLAERALHLGTLHFFIESRDTALQLGFDLVDETPNYRTLFGRHFAHPPHNLGQFA